MLGHRRGDGEPDPARRAGDDRNLAAEVKQPRAGHPNASACLANSIRAIERLWTSSGPSARRSVRIPAQLPASCVSWLTPAPPWAWIASSIIFSAMRGALTLIIEISALAAWFPTLLIKSAALRRTR